MKNIHAVSGEKEMEGRGNENEIVPSPLPEAQAGSIYANF
jgi:hypothetical protein